MLGECTCRPGEPSCEWRVEISEDNSGKNGVCVNMYTYRPIRNIQLQMYPFYRYVVGGFDHV